MRLWFIPGFKICSHLGSLWHVPDNGVEDFCINYLNSYKSMIPFYKGENRKSEKCLELPKVTHLSKGGLTFKLKSWAWAPFHRQLLS